MISLNFYYLFFGVTMSFERAFGPSDVRNISARAYTASTLSCNDADGFIQS